jgi:hypothetical protein
MAQWRNGAMAQWRKRLEIFVLKATVHGVARNPIEIPHVI